MKILGFQINKKPAAVKPEIELAYGVINGAIAGLLKTFQHYTDDLAGSKGYDVYKKMLNDSHVQGVLSQFYGMVLGAGWEIAADQDAENEEEAARQADFVKYAVENIAGSFTDNLLDMLDAHALGFSISEIVWRIEQDGPYAGYITLKALKHKDPATFEFMLDDYGNVLELKQSPIGIKDQPTSLPVEKFLIHRNRATYGVPWGRSDLRSAYKAWWLKDWVQKWFAVFMQRTSTPTPYGRFKTGTPKSQQDDMLEILGKLQSETAMVIPETWELNFMQVASGSHDAFLRCLEWCDQQISKAILTQTLTSGEGARVGSMALGNVHMDALKTTVRVARERLTETINDQLIRRLIDLNFAERYYPKLVIIEPPEETLTDWANAIIQLTNTGLTLVTKNDTAQIRERLGLAASMPVDYEGDKTRIAGTIDILNRAEAVSLETKVRMLHPDWTDSEINAEIERIKEENGRLLPDGIQLGLDETEIPEPEPEPEQ